VKGLQIAALRSIQAILDVQQAVMVAVIASSTATTSAVSHEASHRGQEIHENREESR